VKIASFSAELKRRNVYKVATAYAVIAWLLFEAVAVCLHIVEGPASLIKALAVFLVLGFAITVYISWAFEATPGGLKRTARVSPSEMQVLPTWSVRKFTAFIVATALLAASLLVFDLVRGKPTPLPAAAAPEATNNQ
jgi:hypothetical protein